MLPRVPVTAERPPTIFRTAASCSCDAPAASSPPLAICSIARRSCSAAAAASARPLASSSVAAATRSEALACRARRWLARGRGASVFEPGASVSRLGSLSVRSGGRNVDVLTRAIKSSAQQRGHLCRANHGEASAITQQAGREAGRSRSAQVRHMPSSCTSPGSARNETRQSRDWRVRPAFAWLRAGPQSGGVRGRSGGNMSGAGIYGSPASSNRRQPAPRYSDARRSGLTVGKRDRMRVASISRSSGTRTVTSVSPRRMLSA